MKKAITILFILTFMLFGASGLWLTDSQPLVNNQYHINNQDIHRLQTVIANRQQNPISVTERDVNLALQQFIEYTGFTVSGQLRLGHAHNTLQLSIHNGLPLRPFINIDLTFYNKDRRWLWVSGGIGKLRLSATQLTWLEQTLLQSSRIKQFMAEVKPLWESIEHIEFGQQRAKIYFYQGPQFQARIQQLQLNWLLGRETRERLPIYQTYLDTLATYPGRRLSLASVLKQLAQFAQQQTPKDATVDNKAMLISLFLHTANHHHFAALDLANLLTLPKTPLRLTLENRDDLAQHFLATATLTLFANSTVAKAAGMYKEQLDLEQARGFNLRDLIADHAGSMLATKMTNDITNAKHFQQKLANLTQENELLPDTTTLAAQLEAQHLNSHKPLTKRVLAHLNTEITHYLSQSPIYSP